MEDSKIKELKNNLAKALHSTSIEDLESARGLYNSGKYPNSIFLLQQSTEKLSKAIGILLDIVVPGNLRQISHSPHKMYKNATKARLEDLSVNEDSYIKIIGVSEYFVHYKAQLKESLQAINDLSNAEFRYINLEELDEMLEFIINPENSSENDFVELRRSLTSNLREFYNKIPVEGKTLTEHLDQFMEKGKIPTFEQIAELEIYSISLNQTLLILSYILSPHQNSSRYPCECCGCMPSEEYKIDHPIIIRFVDIENIIITCLNLFMVIFHSLNKTEQNDGIQ